MLRSRTKSSGLLPRSVLFVAFFVVVLGQRHGFAQPKQPEMALPTLSVRITGFDSILGESSNPHLLIEEFDKSQLYPILPYIFFSENSSEIPSRYDRLTHRQSNTFQAEDVHASSPLDVYHQTLNILGRRLKDRFPSTITIAGFFSNDSVPNVAESRAKAVRQYLREIWHIDTSRMHLVAGGLPTNASTMTVQDGVEENRRVEITSDDSTLMSPLILDDTMRVATPPILRFYLGMPNPAPKEWYFEVFQKNRRLFHTFGGAEPLEKPIEWAVIAQKDNIPTLDGFLTYRFQTVDSNERSTSTEGQFSVEILTLSKKVRLKMADKEYDKYSLILFDFDSSTLTPKHREMLALLRQRIQSDTVISMDIRGYSDRTGSADYDDTLATRRAEAVATGLGVEDLRKKYMFNLSMKGLGKDVPLYDNDTPEGRFYSRTVDVLVERSVQH